MLRSCVLRKRVGSDLYYSGGGWHARKKERKSALSVLVSLSECRSLLFSWCQVVRSCTCEHIQSLHWLSVTVLFGSVSLFLQSVSSGFGWAQFGNIEWYCWKTWLWLRNPLLYYFSVSVAQCIQKKQPGGKLTTVGALFRGGAIALYSHRIICLLLRSFTFSWEFLVHLVPMWVTLKSHSQDQMPCGHNQRFFQEWNAEVVTIRKWSFWWPI